MLSFKLKDRKEAFCSELCFAKSREKVNEDIKTITNGNKGTHCGLALIPMILLTNNREDYDARLSLITKCLN